MAYDIKLATLNFNRMAEDRKMKKVLATLREVRADVGERGEVPASWKKQ